MKSIKISRTERPKDTPHTGHNRWHPDVTPVLEVDPGEEVVLDTRDAADGQIKPGMTVAIGVERVAPSNGAGVREGGETR